VAASKQETQSRPATYGRHCAIANAGAAARGSAAVAKPAAEDEERLARSWANVELIAARKAAAGVALYWLHPRLSIVACGSEAVPGTHAEAAASARAAASTRRTILSPFIATTSTRLVSWCGDQRNWPPAPLRFRRGMVW
jgi:hypothetical protein